MKTMKRKWMPTTAWVIVLLFGARGVFADPVPYDDVIGATVDFVDISEDSPTDAGPLFGEPTSNGSDSLPFNDLTFSSSATGGTSDSTVGVLSVTIMSHPGLLIDAVTFTAAGDFTFVTALGGTAATAASAEFVLAFLVLETASGPNGQTGDTELAIDPDGGEFDAINNPGGPNTFDGEQMFDLVNDLGLPGNVTKLQVTATATLASSSESDPLTSSSIALKDFVAIGATVVPEPTSAAVLAGGILMLLRRRRR